MKHATGGLRAVSPLAVLAPLACIVVAAFFATDVTAGRAAATKGPQTFTLYSVTQVEQFLDHSDDRSRGKGNNPFGNFKDSKTVTKEAGNGPVPRRQRGVQLRAVHEPGPEDERRVGDLHLHLQLQQARLL